MRIDGCIEKEVNLLSALTIDKKSFDKIIIREAVGVDCEIASVDRLKKSSPDVLASIVQNVVVSVPGASRQPSLDEIKSLPVTTLENIIVELSILSAGPEYDYKQKCTNKVKKEGVEGEVECGQLLADTIDKTELLETEKVSLSNTVTLVRGIKKGDKVLKKVTFKPIDVKAQEQLLHDKEKSSGKMSQLNSNMMWTCIVDIDGVKVDLDDVRNMSTIDRKKLTEALQDAMNEPKTVLKLTCPKCGGEVRHMVNVLDFLV